MKPLCAKDRTAAVIACCSILIGIPILAGCSFPSDQATRTPPPILTLQSPQPAQTSVTKTNTQLPVPTAPAAFPLAGTWTGEAKNGSLVMAVTIVLQPSCQAGQVCGTYDLKQACSGEFSLVGESGGVYEFHAGNKSAMCSGEGQDYLHLLPDGSLRYESRGEYGETLGTLTRSGLAASTSTPLQGVPLIYDDDGSPDGTSALLYLLLLPGVDLQSAGVSYGEAHPAEYIQFIGGILENAGLSAVPLGAGLDGTLSGGAGFPEWMRDAAGNFWGWPIPHPEKAYIVHDEAGLIIQVVKQSPRPVRMFFSGPLTNLALALRQVPEIRDKVEAVYVMGGAVGVRGNVHDFFPDSANTFAEWNIYSDPVAAKEVFESGLALYLVPLDATNQVQINFSDTTAWRQGGKTANFVADIYDGLIASSGKSTFYIWDLMTAEIMLHPSLCEFQPLRLEVVTEAGDHFGQTVRASGEPNIHVCLKPDATGLKQELIDTFANSQS